MVKHPVARGDPGIRKGGGGVAWIVQKAVAPRNPEPRQAGEALARTPVVLIVCEHEWFSRSLGTILAPRGYAVIRAYNGRQALQRAAGVDPDVVFVDGSLSDMEGSEVCRQLLAQDLVSGSTALILLTLSPVTREYRIQALEAGAWDVLTLPLDGEELVLRVDRYIRGKLESDRLGEQALIDPATGLYSWRGIEQRVREMGAAAERFGRPLACIVFATGLDENGEEPPTPVEATAVAALLRDAIRKSDVLARIGPQDYVVVAPDTSRAGAKTLVERLQRRSRGTSETHPVRFRTGIYAVDNLRESNLDPVELLLRATAASRPHHTN
jgi:two-component system, cell cycle response regulator